MGSKMTHMLEKNKNIPGKNGLDAFF